MIETNANPNQIINWFRSSRCSDDLLLVWVSGEKEHEKILKDIMEDVPAIDAVLQNNICFLLVSDENPVTSIHNGSISNSLFFRSINTLRNIDKPDKFQNISKNTRQKASEFALAFDLNANEIPCLVIMIRGLDQHIVFPIDINFSLKNIRVILEGLSLIVNSHQDQFSDFRVRPDRNGYILCSMGIIDDKIKSLEAKYRDFRSNLRRVNKKYSIFGEIGSEIIKISSEEKYFPLVEMKNEINKSIDALSSMGRQDIINDHSIRKMMAIIDQLILITEFLSNAQNYALSTEMQYEKYQIYAPILREKIEQYLLEAKIKSYIRNAVGKIVSFTPKIINIGDKVIEILGKHIQKFP